MRTTVEVWERYAKKTRLRRSVNAAGATTWLNWTQYADHGPDESILGEVADRTVVELGSGSGSNLAHLATLGANCTGVDIAPSRTALAARTWGHLPNLRFVTADAVEYLVNSTASLDVVYSIFGAVWFTDPKILLPLVRTKMNRGGIFAFSQEPFTAKHADANRVITKWQYSTEQWARMLTAEGFGSVTAEVVPAPKGGQLGTLLVHALAA